MAKQNRKVRKVAEHYMNEILDGTLIEDILENAHTDLYHTGDQNKDTKAKLERVLCADTSKRKKAQSTFQDSRKIIQNILLYNTETIAKWMVDNKPPKERITIVGPTDDKEPHGIGVRYVGNKLQECYAKETTIVLKRDNTPYGFSCVTAYPNIMRESAVPTYRDIRKDLHQTNAYKNAKKQERKEWDKAVVEGMRHISDIMLTDDDLKFVEHPLQL